MTAKTFREAYDVLHRHAATLREQDEPNIDDLLDIVNESVAAYKVCKERIDAVEKALGEALTGAGLERNLRSATAAPAEASMQTSRPTPTRTSGTNFDEESDDIPF